MLLPWNPPPTIRVTTTYPGADANTVLESVASPIEEQVNGLTAGSAYRWRVRVQSTDPFFPRSPWISLPGNAASEMDLRTAELVAASALLWVLAFALTFAAYAGILVRPRADGQPG